MEGMMVLALQLHLFCFLHMFPVLISFTSSSFFIPYVFFPSFLFLSLSFLNHTCREFRFPSLFSRFTTLLSLLPPPPFRYAPIHSANSFRFSKTKSLSNHISISSAYVRSLFIYLPWFSWKSSLLTVAHSNQQSNTNQIINSTIIWKKKIGKAEWDSKIESKLEMSQRKQFLCVCYCCWICE